MSDLKMIKTIYNIAESIQRVTDCDVKRIDIQRVTLGDIRSYCGYLLTESMSYRIRPDGTFEEIEDQ